MKVTWKPAKNRANQKKHRLSFEAAQFVFDDPLHLTHPHHIGASRDKTGKEAL